MIDYHKKYLKYKLKYLNFKKNMIGGMEDGEDGGEVHIQYPACSPDPHNQGPDQNCWIYAVASLIRQFCLLYKTDEIIEYWNKLGLMGHSEPTHQDYKDLPTHSYIRNYLQFPSLELIEQGLEPWINYIFQRIFRIEMPKNLCITREELYAFYRTGQEEGVPLQRKQYSKQRMGAMTKDIRHITRMGLQIWLPNFQWRSKKIAGTNNIATDIKNLKRDLDDDVLIDIPFILQFKNYNGRVVGHSVIGFLNNERIFFKNSHGEDQPTEFVPREHRLLGSGTAVYNFIIFRPYGWDVFLTRDNEEDFNQDTKIFKILENSRSAHDDKCRVKKQLDIKEHIDLYRQFYDDDEVPNISIDSDIIDIFQEDLVDVNLEERDMDMDMDMDMG